MPAIARVACVVAVALSLLAAVVTLKDTWTWWRNSEKVSVTVTQAIEGTLYEVDFDGIRAKVDLDRVHDVGDVVEVLFDPTGQGKLQSKSRLIGNLTGGLFYLALGVGLAVCFLVDRRFRSRAITAGASR